VRALFALLLFGLSWQAAAQKTNFFHITPGPIVDFAGADVAQPFGIEVQGLPNRIDSTFGLEEVCFTVLHPKISDLKIELRSPDGTLVWLTNRNGGDLGQNYLNTCLRMDGFHGRMAEGKPPFTGTFVPDGRFDHMNNGQNPNGTWLVLVHDLAAGNTGSFDACELKFGNRPAKATTSACAPTAPTHCLCPDGSTTCTLLPDLIVSKRISETGWQEYGPTDATYPNQLRLAVATVNIGLGPMETRGTGQWVCGTTPVAEGSRCPDGNAARQRICQVIYKRNGNRIDTSMLPAGTNYFDEKPGHNHFHADDWVSFSLRKPLRRQKNPLKWKTVGSGTKVSYCLWDTGVCTDSNGLCSTGTTVWGQSNLRNYGFGHYVGCESLLQGISVGGIDNYGLHFEGQSIALPKKLRNGRYALVIVVDPKNRYRESDETNNVVVLPVSLKLRKR